MTSPVQAVEWDTDPGNRVNTMIFYGKSSEFATNRRSPTSVKWSTTIHADLARQLSSRRSRIARSACSPSASVQSSPEQVNHAALRRSSSWRGTVRLMGQPLTLTAVFTPDEGDWTMAQLVEWPAVVTCARTVEAAREMLLDAAREMIASYRDEGREPPIGGGHVDRVTIDLAAARGAES